MRSTERRRSRRMSKWKSLCLLLRRMKRGTAKSSGPGDFRSSGRSRRRTKIRKPIRIKIKI